MRLHKQRLLTQCRSLDIPVIQGPRSFSTSQDPVPAFNPTALFRSARAVLEWYYSSLLPVSMHAANTDTEFAADHGLIVDSIFGFSFNPSGEIREPFGSLIKDIVAVQGAGVPVASVRVSQPAHCSDPS